MKKFGIVLILLLFTACGQKSYDKTSSVNDIKTPPFGGYVCGFRGDTTFLQFPIFIPDGISKNSIVKIILSGDKEFSCSRYNFSTFSRSKYEGYMFSILSFRVIFPEAGDFCVDKLNIFFEDEKSIELKLGKIFFDIRENESPAEYLSVRSFLINDSKLSELNISYVNNTDKPIIIENFSYPEDVCSNVKIEKFDKFGARFELPPEGDGYSRPKERIAEKGLVVPPHSEKAFIATFDFDAGFANNEGRFFYFLPFVEYKIDNEHIIMPAQIQATVIQPTFTEEVVKSFIE